MVLKTILGETPELFLNQAMTKSECSHRECGGHLSIDIRVVAFKKLGSFQQLEVIAFDLNRNAKEIFQFSSPSTLININKVEGNRS